jgi:hypothetical protein
MTHWYSGLWYYLYEATRKSFQLGQYSGSHYGSIQNHSGVAYIIYSTAVSIGVPVWYEDSNHFFFLASSGSAHRPWRRSNCSLLYDSGYD